MKLAGAGAEGSKACASAIPQGICVRLPGQTQELLTGVGGKYRRYESFTWGLYKDYFPLLATNPKKDLVLNVFQHALPFGGKIGLESLAYSNN